MKNEEISKNLEGQGYKLQEIQDAINQAKIKEGVKGNKMPEENVQGTVGQQPAAEEDFNIPPPPGAEGLEAPGATPEGASPPSPPSPPGAGDYSTGMQSAPVRPQYQMPAQPAMGVEDMQAVVEQIVEEKWKEMMGKVGDISLFKSRVGDDMEAVKQELLRTQKRLEDLQVAVLGKVKEYNKGVESISTDMKALEQVFSKIIGPLTTNVKELSKITEDLKGHKKN